MNRIISRTSRQPVAARRLFSPALVLFFTLFLLSNASTQAQTALTGGLRGSVTDIAGAALAGASVHVESKSLSISQEAVTDADGRFTISGLTPAGDYVLSVTANGFRVFNHAGVIVVSTETNAVDARLEVAPVNETVTVTGDAEQVAASPEVSQIINEKRLNELPIYNRNLNRFALLDPHVRNTSPLGSDGSNATRLSINGRIFRETHYKLDGNSNYDALFNNAPLQTVSLSAVQEFKILTNQYSAEHGGTSAGFLIVTTKSGTNNLNGEAFFFGRPSGIQARPPLADRRIPNQFLQFGGSVGGPIVKDKTFFFVNYEGTRQERGSFVDRPVSTFFLGSQRDTLALVKLDHRFSDTHDISVRLNGSRNTNTNANDRITFLAQSAQPIQPSAATLSITQAVGAQVNDTMTFGKLINELRFSYVNAVPSSSVPVTPSVGIIRTGVSTEGNSTVSSIRLQNYQLGDQVSIQTGQHSIRFGGDFVRQKVRDFTYQQFGTYTLSAAGVVQSFTQQLGIGRLRYGQTRLDGFVQDDWRIRPRLTLNLGLRYDYQSIVKDYNNFGPRVGFAFDATGDGNTIIRGGAGVYFDQPFYHGFTQRYLQNGLNTQTRAIALGAPEAAALYPRSFDPLDPLAAAVSTRNLFLRGDDLTSPYSSQFSVGLQRKLFGDFVATLDAYHTLSVRQFQAININAPAPFPRTAPGQTRTSTAADQTRPFYNAALGYSVYQGVRVRNVLVSANVGTAHYDALDIGLRKRFGQRYSFESHYVYSSAIDSVTDDHLGINPNEFSDIGRAERAQSDFNQRQRFVTYGTVALPLASQLSVTAALASGLPVNAITGTDNNGDNVTVDRPSGFGRNAFRGPRQARFDASYVKAFALNRVRETMRLELRADAFNVFNNSNFYLFNNTYGNGALPSATFLRPLSGISSVDPGRQLQFGLRLLF